MLKHIISFIFSFTAACVVIIVQTCTLKRSLRNEFNSQINKIEYSSLSLEELKQLKSFEYELNKKKYFDKWKREQVEDYNHAVRSAILNGYLPKNTNVIPTPILEL